MIMKKSKLKAPDKDTIMEFLTELDVLLKKYDITIEAQGINGCGAAWPYVTVYTNSGMIETWTTEGEISIKAYLKHKKKKRNK